MKIQRTEMILELRSMRLSHYDAKTGEAVYTEPKQEALGTYKQLLPKQAELRNQAIEEGNADKVIVWITPPPPVKKSKKGTAA